MKIGIYEKAINNKFSWEEKITIAKQAGYDFIEFSIDESDFRLARLDWSKAKINHLRQILIKHDFAFNSMTLSAHRRFPFGSKNKQIRHSALLIMHKAIRLASHLGIKNIQLAGYDVYYEASNMQTKNYFYHGLLQAVKWAMEYSVMLSFEIMDTTFINTISKAMQWVNKINSPWLTIYPDCGNLYQWVKNDEEFIKEVKTGQNKIVAAHFKDTKPQVFREVAFGKGSVNFKVVFQAFAAINFQGPWLIEMWSKNNPQETIKQNVQVIKKALDFFNQKRQGIL